VVLIAVVDDVCIPLFSISGQIVNRFDNPLKTKANAWGALFTLRPLGTSSTSRALRTGSTLFTRDALGAISTGRTCRPIHAL
jgi:hypothetical protein